MIRICWKITTEKKKENVLNPVSMPAATLKLLFIFYLPGLC